VQRGFLSVLRCPSCGGELAPAHAPGADGSIPDGALSCACGQSFSVSDGVPDLVLPRGQAYGEENAETYDRDIAFIAALLNEDEREVRSAAIDQLEIGPGSRVLEVACGPGPNLPLLAERVGAAGVVAAFDISPSMIRAAARRVHGSTPRVDLALANGVHLPFADGAFDAVLHVGTLNRFSDVRRALAEMARVVKVGGKVLAADEGLGPWLAGEEYGAVLMRFGGLFKGAPPLAALPPNAEQVAVRWLMGHAYFAIDFRVGAVPPRLNLDVPLPGRTVTVRDVLEAQARRP
jgi:SAM-dependent methyltransferase